MIILSMFNQQKKEAPQNQPYIMQLDELINKQLHSSPPPINFKLIGSSNGIVMDKLFPHKAMIYINALDGNDELRYQLIIVALQFANPVVKKVPLLYSGQLSKLKVQKVSELSKVQIEMQQSPKQQVILAVKISVLSKNAEQYDDTLSILILNLEQIAKPSFKMLHLLKIKSGDNRIYDYAWHPLSNLTIMVLTSTQNLQIWNLNQEDFYKPSHVIRIKHLKNNYNLSNQVKFRRFATVNQDLNLENQIQNKGRENKINFNKYALFIMNSNGDVISVFPFLPIGSSISRQQYDFIYDTQRDNSKQKIALSAYLNGCELVFCEQDGTYLISSTPTLQGHYQVQKWYKNGRIPKITQASKMVRQQQFYNFKVFPLSEQCLLLVQVVHKTHASLNAICLSLINKQVQIDESLEVDNVIYEIAEIRNQINNKQQDVRFINSDSKANQIGLSKFKALFYTEANSLFRLDLSPIFNFVQSNDLKPLEGEEPFPVALIFTLGPFQFIAAMAAQQSLNCFNFVRRSKNKAKFQIQPLGYVNAFSEIQNIVKASNQLIRKLNNLKVEPTAKTNTQQKDQKNQLQMNPQKLRQYQQKGIESVKKDYARYSENIRNSIDQGMSKLKINYEIMKKRLKQFNSFKQKRNLLNSLLEEVQQNNEQINNLLFDNNEPNQNSTGELSQIQRNINTLNQLFLTARKKDLSINSDVQATMSKDIDELSNRLKLVRFNLEQAKKLKRKIKSDEEE